MNVSNIGYLLTYLLKFEFGKKQPLVQIKLQNELVYEQWNEVKNRDKYKKARNSWKKALS